MDFGKLVDGIYQCAAEVDGWRPMLANLSEQFGADKAHLFLIGAEGLVLETLVRGYDEATIGKTLEDFHSHYQFGDPRVTFASQHPGRIGTDDDVDAIAPFDQSAIYNEILRPIDIRYSMFVVAPVPGGLTVAQAYMRPERRPRFGRNEVAEFTAALPHLNRALHLRQLLVAARQETRDLQRALDLLGTPAAIAAADGTLVCLSTAAAAFFREATGLSVRGGKVRAKDPGAAAALATALAQAAAGAEPSDEPPPVPSTVLIPREGQRPLALVLHSLRPTCAFRDQGGRTARVLIIFQDLEVNRSPSLEAFSRLHVLTATEALLVAHLAAGGTVAEFAIKRGTSIHTARTHLKRALEKTGCHRQVELVRLALQASGPAQRDR